MKTALELAVEEMKMPEDYDSMMNKTLEAYGVATDAIPDPQTFTVIEQTVYEYVNSEENK